jgi:hypothetical protein
MNKDIQSYNNSLSETDKLICEALFKEIDSHLPGSENKIWHGHPVWFINGNPIVGYSKLKDRIQLLFWSGQSFNEDQLQEEGKFKAAKVDYISLDQINSNDIQKWLAKAVEIQWDYKNIVKNRGELERLK